MIAYTLSLYLKLNLILVVGYIVFRLSQRFQGSQNAALRLGQALLLISLGIPLTMEWLPQKFIRPLPRTFQTVIPSFPEFGDGPQLIPNNTKTKSEIATAVLLSSAPISTAEMALCLLLLAIALQTIRLGILRVRLGQIIARSHPIKTLGRVTIAVTSESSVPFSARLNGVAWILLPEPLLAHWRDTRLAVAHEVQHHRQGDLPWAMGLEFFTAAFLPNPIAHFWKRTLFQLQEFSCDEALIGREISSHDYGGCLLRVAEAALSNRARQHPGRSGLPRGGGEDPAISQGPNSLDSSFPGSGQGADHQFASIVVGFDSAFLALGLEVVVVDETGGTLDRAPIFHPEIPAALNIVLNTLAEPRELLIGITEWPPEGQPSAVAHLGVVAVF